MNILLVVLFTCAHCQSFISFKTEMEEIVTNLTIAMDEIYSRRCQKQIRGCQILSYYECDGTAAKMCFEDFPKADACLNQGVYLSEQSSVRFPPGIDINSLTNEEKQFVCTSAYLEDKFQELDDGRNKRYGRAYIGTSLGSFRAYPAIGGCSGDYDPRFRPWYVAATAGSKNIVLIIDVSGSMQGEGISLAKQAGKSVINTLSNSDFVGVVSFQSFAKLIYSDKIERATQQVKEELLSAIDGLSASGGTNYEDGLRKAFDTLTAAQQDEFGAPCQDGQNIFLFLTDGEPTQGLTESDQLLSVLAQFNTDITLFTYALGRAAREDILEDLSCAYNGISFKVTDTSSGSSLATVMRNYYTFIAEGVTTESPVWTEPYEDAFGLGRMVTVSMPVYYYENSIRKILGVVGVDVSMPQMESFKFTEEQLIKKLISNAPCHSSNLTECEIDQLRDNSCGVYGCPTTSDIKRCSNPPENIFLEPVESSAYICCGLSIALLVVIIVIVVIIILIVVCLVVKKLRKNAELKKQEKKIDSNEKIV